MNSESRFTPSDKSWLDRRQSKVAPDSFAVKRDKIVNRIVGKFSGSGDDDSLYESRSGKTGQRQREKFESITRTLEKEWLPEFKNQFIEKIEMLRQNGDVNLSLVEVEKRLADIQIYFFDKGTATGEKIDAKGANSRFSSVHIEIDTNFPGDEKELRADLQHTFNHEMLHAVSGSLFLTTPRHLGVFNTEKYRRGLAFGPTAKGEDVERFVWLNEAVTETLALSMDKDVDLEKAPYRAERQLLSLLINGPAGSTTQKIDKNKFYHAYFENYESKDLDQNRLQYWKELIKTINEEYHPGFLLELDKIIKEKGFGFAISQFHNLCKAN